MSKDEMLAKLKEWYDSWNRHDLAGVMSLLHDDIVFENWAGRRINGKKNLQRAWKAWFENHYNFIFDEIETFIDEAQQKALFRWILDWTPPAPYGKAVSKLRERREGIDVLHFCENKIIKKMTYSKIED